MYDGSFGVPGGVGGKRPDRCSLVYAQRCKEAWGDVPIVLGGIEASLRRVAHYDYWQDKVRRSILVDAHADILLYGNAERALADLAHRLAKGERIDEITDPAYFERKREENDRLYSSLVFPADTHTASPSFDLYCRQNFLDNLLRGGFPASLGRGETARSRGRDRVAEDAGASPIASVIAVGAHYDGQGLSWALGAALRTWEQPALWRRLQRWW